MKKESHYEKATWYRIFSMSVDDHNLATHIQTMVLESAVQWVILSMVE
jgi:hypothetical protein